jgi:hemophore-related protein
VVSRLMTRIVWLAGAAAALPLLAQNGVAAAQPGNGPLIHTTCSYEQVYAAIRTEAPRAATELDNRPVAQQTLKDFVAMPVEQRQQRLDQLLADHPQWQAKIDEKWNTPEGQEKVQRMARVAETCHGY